jgi:hypothetical protein
MRMKVTPNFNLLFNDKLEELPRTIEHVRALDTSVRALTSEERDKVIMRVMKTVYSPLSKTGDADKWERCWKDVLDKFKETKDATYLVPPFVKRGQECRLWGDYVATNSKYFEENVDTILRSWVFERYMEGNADIFEFGCGSGWNLLMMSQYFPGRKIHGVEWSKSAVEIANCLGGDIQGHWFDMFNPGELDMPEGSIVFTHGAMEQMGFGYGPFVDFLIDKKVRRVIHVEVIDEFYDPTKLIDYLAIQFHQKRNYLTGYLSYLEGLQSGDMLHIVKSQHVQFGSLFQDGFSVIVWEPNHV